MLATTYAKAGPWRSVVVAALGVIMMLTHIAQGMAADSKPQAKPVAAAKQKSYASPEEAVKEFIGAARAGDLKALLAILGPDAKAIVSSSDAVADRQGRERFVKAYEEANKVETAGGAKAVLSVGKDEWPFPVPIVKDAAGWRFDSNDGRQEILNRRIGRNELSAMQAALAYVDAQREYYLRNPKQDKLLSYAQKFASAPGKRDGLYFPTKEGEPQSPLGPLFAQAKAEGYAKGEGGKPLAYHGYHYRILKGQGSDAAGGAYDYVAQGKMIGGHALVAWPATYGNSGVMTFMVNHSGVLYERDLGPDTAAAVAKIAKFDPDRNWRRVDKK